MGLFEFIRGNRSAIIEAWAAETRDQSEPAKLLDRDALIDHLPRLLDDIAETIRTQGARPSVATSANTHADDHAWERIDQGFTLDHLVRELALLRTCILRLWRHQHPDVSVDDAEVLTRVVDRAIERSVLRFFERRSQVLEGIEQIADAAFDVDDVKTFLDRVLRIFMRHAPSIDSAAILLREAGRESVRLHATIGLEDELLAGFTLRFGEGFAGTIAATAKPLSLPDAWENPLVGEAHRRRKTRTLYGVPLLDRIARSGLGNVVGVAQIGSCTVSDIPEPEKHIFATLAQRATSAIIKHQLREDLQSAIQVLERTAEFRERFVGIVSHDLRNPLNAITMSTGIMLRSPDLAPSLSKPVGRILSNVDRMTHMIADLLDLTRGRLGGGIPLSPAPTDLTRIARRILDEYEQTHPQRRIEFAASGNVRGTWDEERLAQVLSNLIANAIQYGDPTGTIRCAVDGSSGLVTLTVHNDGSPIPGDMLPHIFDPFRRASSDRSASGLGLGLFIASEVTRAHGGTIAVASDETGTTFTVTIPRDAPT